MKTSVLLKTFFIIILFFSGCKEENLVGIMNNTKGSVEFKINANTTPTTVQRITAFLTRQNYDTLSTSILINSDSLNVLSLQQVPVGSWHLIVDAANSEGKVIYSGETDIIIVEDETIDVYLTLIPTGSGEGNVNIYVSWGEGSWIDINDNPIFDNPSIPYGAAQCKVIFDDNKCKMWYTALFSASQAEIWYVESPDGINWDNSTSFPVLKKGEPGTWDDYRVGVGAVLKDDNDYKMYFCGWRNQNSVWQVGMAVSNDGINWQKYSEPVLSANETEFQIGASDVIKKDNMYYMYYTYSSDPYSSEHKISLAISSDGITWNRYSQNPILTATMQWEGNGISYPTVIFDNNKFVMIYQNQFRTAFGSAISNDGIHWTKNVTNSIFGVNNLSNYWTSYINYPFFRKFSREYRLYYTGTGYNSVLKLGVALKYN